MQSFSVCVYFVWATRIGSSHTLELSILNNSEIKSIHFEHRQYIVSKTKQCCAHFHHACDVSWLWFKFFYSALCVFEHFLYSSVFGIPLTRSEKVNSCMMLKFHWTLKVIPLFSLITCAALNALNLYWYAEIKLLTWVFFLVLCIIEWLLKQKCVQFYLSW